MQPVMSVKFNLAERTLVLPKARTKLAHLEANLAALQGKADDEVLAGPSPPTPSTQRLERILKHRLKKHERWQEQGARPSGARKDPVRAIRDRLGSLGSMRVKTLRARLQGAIARQKKKIARVEKQTRPTPWPMHDLKAWYRIQGPGSASKRLVIADRDKHSAKNLLYLGLAEACGKERPPPFRRPPDQPT